MKRSLFGFFFVALMSVCCSGYTLTCYDGEHYEKIADKITDETAKKLQKEFGLECVGVGGGMMNTIYTMSMTFNYFHELSLVEARELVVNASEEYLKAINSSKRVRPYLKNYPFTIKNVEVDIYSLTEKGGDVSSDQIEYISVIDGVVIYALPYPEKGRRPILHKESYEEALRIVNEEKALKNNCEIKSESVSE